MPEPRTLRLRVLWKAPAPGANEDYRAFLLEHGTRNLEGLATEFGLQRGRWEVIAGTPWPDGSMAFETEIEPYTDKAGRQRFRGEHVQGPPDEPFLYLSWRVAGEDTWIGRAKVPLTPLTEEVVAAVPETAVFETDVTRFGHRDRGQVQEWRTV